jgi:hypothetical protein
MVGIANSGKARSRGLRFIECLIHSELGDIGSDAIVSIYNHG